MKSGSVILVALLVLTATVNVAAEGGTESPFSFGAGARELALGGATVSGSSDATSVFWNPSALSLAQKLSVCGMHSEMLIDGVAYQYLGMALPTLDMGSFGIGLFRQSIQDIEKRDDNNLYLGQFDDSHIRVYLGYGRRLGQFEIGASLSLDHQSIDTYRATSSPGLTLAISHLYTPKASWLHDLKISGVVRNLLKPGIKLSEETYRYPTSVDVGGSILIGYGRESDHTLEPFLSLHKTESVPMEVSAGLEYSYKQVLNLRAGLREDRLSFGAGLDLKVASFDYAIVDRDMDFVHLFALSGYFGLSVDERRQKRVEKQEADFREAMSDQMRKRNLSLVDDLLAAGQSQLAEGHYEEAAGSFDRLVFLARSTGLDDAEYQRLLDSAVSLRSAAEEADLLQTTMDSARASYAIGDLLAARYLALQALKTDSTCRECSQLFEKADKSLQRQSERTEFLASHLTRIDSLIESSKLEQAEQLVQSLVEIAPDDEAVMHRIDRLELEKLRRKLASIEAQRKRSEEETIQTALPIGDTANLGSGAQKTKSSASLSEEQKTKLMQLYQEAKEAFNSGDVRTAIGRWEIVLAQAPDFLSVKEFLVKAYKFLGLELYGQKQRTEAVAVWKKALSLDPDNVDIAEYIRRAETQIKKLEELAHESTTQ